MKIRSKENLLKISSNDYSVSYREIRTPLFLPLCLRSTVPHSSIATHYIDAKEGLELLWNASFQKKASLLFITVHNDCRNLVLFHLFCAIPTG